MSTLTLTLMSAPRIALDLSALQPAKLLALKPTALRRLRLPAGKRQVALADLFEIAGDDARSLRLVGLNAACHRVGMGMTAGKIEIKGAVGDELGREMRGGEIRVSGNAGIGVGQGMRGGFVQIGGAAGDSLGGVTPGATHGMNGGVIVVVGNVGTRCGERMRRGLIAVGGNAGEYLGDRMLAGTIAVLGQVESHAGFALRRGTLLLAHAPVMPAAGYQDCGQFELGIVRLMRHYLADFHPAMARRLKIFETARRWCGDMTYGGKGEILIAAGR